MNSMPELITTYMVSASLLCHCYMKTDIFFRKTENHSRWIPFQITPGVCPSLHVAHEWEEEGLYLSILQQEQRAVFNHQETLWEDYRSHYQQSQGEEKAQS